MKYQYFIASRWRNRDQVLQLVADLRNLGKSVYCFFESPAVIQQSNADPEKYMADFENMDWENDRYVRKVFENDLEGEKNSEKLILLLPAGKLAHMEAGIAFGMGKRCILIGKPQQAESLYLIFSENYPTIDDFIASLK